MKIVHVITRFNQGGTATWLKTLIPEQVKLGHEVFLLAGWVQSGEIEDSFFNECNGTRIQNLGRSISIFDDLRSFIEIRATLNSIAPDVVNTHTSKAGLIGRLAAISLLKRNLAIVHTYHGHIFYGYFNKVLVELIVFLEKFLSRFTNAFLVSGKQVMFDLIENKICKNNNTFLVNPGLSPKNIPAKIQNNIITVGWLGRLTKVKRPDRVLEIARHFSNVNFLLGGAGDLFDELSSKIPSNLSILGWVEPYEFWAKCDIALLTSENEAQPISLIESQFSGIPAIAENVGSVKDVIVDGENGFLVNGFEQRVSALEKLISDSNLRKSMGKAAIYNASMKFGVDQFLKTHEKAYNFALNIKKSIN